MTSSATELHLGVFGFLPTTSEEANANKMRLRSSSAVRDVPRVFIFTLRPRYIRTWRIPVILIAGKKPEYPKFKPHAGIKMVQVLGCLVYICGYYLPEDALWRCSMGYHWNEYYPCGRLQCVNLMRGEVRSVNFCIHNSPVLLAVIWDTIKAKNKQNKKTLVTQMVHTNQGYISLHWQNLVICQWSLYYLSPEVFELHAKANE